MAMLDSQASILYLPVQSPCNGQAKMRSKDTISRLLVTHCHFVYLD